MHSGPLPFQTCVVPTELSMKRNADGVHQLGPHSFVRQSPIAILGPSKTRLDSHGMLLEAMYSLNISIYSFDGLEGQC